MSEKKGRGTRRSDRPPVDLKAKRAEFVQTFFKKGAELTEELVRENSELRRQIAKLERDNAGLRTQIASDTAMRDLLTKIRQLEAEKDALLSSIHEQEEATGRYANRFTEIESELENFANLYVASYQLHSTLRLPRVVRHVKELLQQLVGARSLAIYVVGDDRRALVPVATEGGDSPPRVSLADGPSVDAAAVIERVYLTGVAFISEGDVKDANPKLPVACVPMRVDDETVGVIVIFSLLEQKHGFVPLDYELFKLLGAHAGTALVGARLFAETNGRIPDLEMLRDAAS